MATIKSYTDLSQSKKLAEILPIESADWTILNCFNEFGEKDGSNIRVVKEVNTLNDFVEKFPCWSLAALRNLLPAGIKVKENTYLFGSHNTFNKSWVYRYYNEEGYSYLYTNEINEIDACYEMILKLNELNLL